MAIILYSHSMSAGLAFTQALYVLVFIGDKTRQGMADFVSTPQISETLNIPKPSVVRILKLLGQEGLVETGAGIKGGVRLSEDPGSISLDRVYRAIEGSRPLFRLDHFLNVTGARPEAAAARISAALKETEEEFNGSLRRRSLADLLG
jgi:Rrf2 family protein